MTPPVSHKLCIYKKYLAKPLKKLQRDILKTAIDKSNWKSKKKFKYPIERKKRNEKQRTKKKNK